MAESVYDRLFAELVEQGLTEAQARSALRKWDEEVQDLSAITTRQVDQGLAEEIARSWENFEKVQQNPVGGSEFEEGAGASFRTDSGVPKDFGAERIASKKIGAAAGRALAGQSEARDPLSPSSEKAREDRKEALIAEGMSELEADIESYEFAQDLDSDRLLVPGGGAGAKREGHTGYLIDDITRPLGWTIEQRVDLQYKMQKAGLYGDSDATFDGTWDERDARAYEELLTQADVLGVSATDLLRRWMDDPRESAEPDGEPPKRTIRVTDPMDVAYATQDIATEVTGRKVSDELVSQIGERYRQAEIAPQNAVDSDQDAGGGGVVADQPSMDTFIENELRKAKPVEAGANDMLGQYRSLLRMLGL